MSNKRLEFKRLLSETDFSNPESIERYAVNLEGMSFRDILDLNIEPEGGTKKNYNSPSYKGGMGNLIEERFFGYKANSDDRPDFPEAGVELKATCFNTLKDGRKSAGERLVITMIPYDRAVSMNYENSHLKTKLNSVLLIYYARDKSIDKLDQKIERCVILRLPEEDMKIIRSDYEMIISYVQQGRADELSEGMTTYLGACTKGASADSSWKDQFYSYTNPETGEVAKRKAKGRAFALKRTFMDYVLHNYVLNAPRTSDIVVNSNESVIDFDEYVIRLIEPHIGKTDRELSDEYDLPYTGNKSQWTTLVYRMLGVKSNRAAEFTKAGIDVRTVRVEKNGKIKESISFAPFKFEGLLNETSWEESSFREELCSKRFFFVCFQKDAAGECRLVGSKFWSMPVSEIDGAAQECWKSTRSVIKEGVSLTLTRQKGGKVIVNNNLPKMSDNPVAHVRPHTQQSAYDLGNGEIIGNVAKDADKLPDGRWMTKQSFWLNSSYLESVLETR